MFTADLPGTYILQLVLNDGHGNSSVDSVLISTSDPGPKADAGMQAVVAELPGETVADLFKRAGMTLVSTVGGASGRRSGCPQNLTRRRFWRIGPR